MSKRKRKWILRSLQALIGLVLILSVVPAVAHLSGGYLHHDYAGSWDYANPDWMAGIPDYRRLSELSIPETHDTMCTTGGFWPETQSLDLVTQLESGIRSLDIRLRRDYGTLEVWHGIYYCNANFSTVLNTVVAFLDVHPSETVLMRIAEGKSPNGWGNYNFIEMVEDDLQPYSDWIWQPTNVNPTLGEVRGKIVILEHFTRVGEPLEEEGDVGMYTSLALDSAGNPHISYYDKTNGSLKYAFWTGDIWWFAPVDDGSGNDVGRYSSMALDEHDHPHISYYDADSGDLKYAYGANWNGYEQGWDWEINLVDSGSENNVGQYSSLALDEDDNPHISYYDATMGELRMAKYVGGSGGNCVLNDDWDCEVVDGFNDMGQYTSLALDGDDNPHISYYDATYGDLRYVRWNGSNWIYNMVDHGQENDVGQYSSLALDVDGNPHISYYDNTSEYELDLKYAFWDNNSGWVIKIGETEGDVGLYTSLALDANNRPHFSYYDATNGDLMYAGPASFCGDGVSAITQFGLKDKLPCFKEKELWSLDTRFDVIKYKWPLVKEQLIEADAGPLDRFYLNGLNATAQGDQPVWNSPFPWFVASGHVNCDTDADRAQTDENCTNGNPPAEYPDFPCSDSGKMLWEGTNELTLTYLNAHPPQLRPRRWGIIVMDFPGSDLIDAIISSNFPHFQPVYLPVISK